MAGADPWEFGSQGFFGAGSTELFFPRECGSLNPDFLPGAAGSSPRDHSEFPGLGTAPDLGESWLEFQGSRMEPGIWAGICRLGWKNPGWNSGNPGWDSRVQAGNPGIQDGVWDLGWNSGIQDEIRDLGWKNPGWKNPGWNSGIQDGRIQVGIPGMQGPSLAPQILGTETIPSRLSGTFQRLRIHGEPRERTG